MATKPTILITDTLFITPDDEHQLETAGYAIERLHQEKADEATLCRAIKGKTGYIIGGLERVTAPVIEAADQLQAIILTGIDYRSFIPAWQEAEAKGIKLGNTPEAPTQGVSEWVMGAILLMNRGYLQLGPTGTETLMPTPGIEDQTVGLIGYGHVGHRVEEMLRPFRPKQIIYHAHHPNPGNAEAFRSLPDLLTQSDIVVLAISEWGNIGFIDATKLAQMKPGALLVSIAHSHIIDTSALYQAIKSGHIRAVTDEPLDPKFSQLPHNRWFGMRASNAFYTPAQIAHYNRLAVQETLRLLGPAQ